MCGIAGILLNPGQVVNEPQLKAMGMTLHHRGPDNFSTYIYRNYGFSHNRLSILDLSDAGNQPFRNDRYILVYNGEIYNYKELRKELVNKGITFHSTSDTAVLFEYLIFFGVPRTLEMIRGMFAFSFCDLQEQVMYLCRDRLGIKPLVWTYNKGSLFWASEVKALAAIIEIVPDPVKTLFAATSSGDHSNEYTVFRNVQQVSPGTYLVCRPGQYPQVVRYYDITQDIDQAYYNELNNMPVLKIKELFQKIFQHSVKRMLMSDAPMGVFVSGGIDSSLIALLACKEKQDLSLFTTNVVGKHSEYADAKLLSEVLRQPLHSATFHPEMMLTDWVNTTYYYECPIVTHTNAIPFSIVARLANERGVKAVLTGEGADELFLGYPKLLAQKYKKLITMPIRLLQSMYNIIPGLREYLFPKNGQPINDFLDLLVQGFERQRFREQGYKSYSFMTPDEMPYYYLTVQMLKEGLVALLHRNDRMGMMASIESRFPYLDEEMVRFAVNLPLKWKIKHSLHFHDVKHPFLLDKALVRMIASMYLPDTLTFKKKNGFPMYGHKNIYVRSGFFRNGYIAQLVGLSTQAEQYMLATQSPYYIAKLVSIEIFGRLFAFHQRPEEITDYILAGVTINLN